jgi:hypothetical protein
MMSYQNKGDRTMSETISRSQLIAGLAGLDPEARKRIEGMLGNMGIKVPVKHKASGYSHAPKSKAPQEYFLHWHITCQLCQSKENRFFKMAPTAEKDCLHATVIDDPAEYEFVEWKTEQKKRATCPQCLQYLESQPHTQICLMVVEAKQIAIPIF